MLVQEIVLKIVRFVQTQHFVPHVALGIIEQQADHAVNAQERHAMYAILLQMGPLVQFAYKAFM